MHHCSKCDRWLSRECFGIDRRRADGRKAWCKSCRHDAGRAYRNANKEAIAAKGAAYERRERETVNARKRLWRDANRERVREIGRRWAERHPEMVLKKNAVRRGADVVGPPVDPVEVLSRHGFKCGICGEPLGDEVHFEHVIPISRGGGHSQDNVQPTHGRCNRVKFNKLPSAAGAEQWQTA